MIERTSIQLGNGDRPMSAGWAAIGTMAQLLVCGLLLDFILFAGTSIDSTIRFALVWIGLFLVMRSQVIWLLAAIIVSHLLREPANPERVHDFSSFLYAVATLSIVAYTASFSNASQRINLSLWSLFHPSSVVLSELEPEAAQEVESSWTSFAMAGLQIIINVLMAMLIFAHLPISNGAMSDWFFRSELIGGWVWPGPSVFLALWVVFILLREFKWRQMKVEQADLYLRTNFILEHFRDLKMILKRKRERENRR